jgi:hypothetical protein
VDLDRAYLNSSIMPRNPIAHLSSSSAIGPIQYRPDSLPLSGHEYMTKSLFTIAILTLLLIGRPFRAVSDPVNGARYRLVDQVFRQGRAFICRGWRPR